MTSPRTGPIHCPIHWQIPCIVLLLAACASRSGWRTGDDFDDEFPDASELVTTADPAGARARLANAQLPATQEHHDALLALLRAQPSIDAPHLALLVEAVHLGRPTFVVHGSRGVVRMYSPRGESPFAGVADELLAAGADKLRDIDARSLGELIGLTQSDATLALLAGRFVPAIDDGSEKALTGMLDGMQGSPSTVPFVDWLAQRGALDGHRGWAALKHVAFDTDRVAVIQALATRNTAVDGVRLVDTIGTLSFDNARRDGLDAIVGRAKPVPTDAARAVVASFSFDSGREAAVATLAGAGGLRLDDAQLVEFVRLCSFDSGRLQCTKILAPQVTGDVTFAAADALLREFSFDGSRLAAVETMAPRWLALSADERTRLAASFSFESSRQSALRLLMK